MHLHAGLKDGMEGSTHAVGQQILKRSRAIQREEEARRPEEEGEIESVATGVENLRIETAGREEDAAEGLEAALGMEIEEEGEDEGEREGTQAY